MSKYIIVNNDGLTLSVITPRHPTQKFFEYGFRHYYTTSIDDGCNFVTALPNDTNIIGLFVPKIDTKKLYSDNIANKLTQLIDKHYHSKPVNNLYLFHHPLLFGTERLANDITQQLNLLEGEDYYVTYDSYLHKPINSSPNARILLINKPTYTEIKPTINLASIDSNEYQNEFVQQSSILGDLIDNSIQGTKLSQIKYLNQAKMFQIENNPYEQFGPSTSNSSPKPALQYVGKLDGHNFYLEPNPKKYKLAPQSVDELLKLKK